MKFKLLTIAMTLFLISCSNDKKAMETSRQASTLRSDILLHSQVVKPYSKPNQNDLVSLSISGETILEGIATFKVTNLKGEEVHCETFSAKKLIQPEYKTANSALKAAQIRDVVAGYFVDDQIKLVKQQLTFAGI